MQEENLSTNTTEDEKLAAARAGGFRARSPEEMRRIWEARPKCKNHPRVIPTKSSVAKGYPLCHFCDPDYREKRKRDLAKKHRLGNRRLMVPASLVETYEAAITDDHLVELREDIAVTEARLQQILSSIKDNPMESSSFITFFNKSFKKQLNLVKRGMLSYPEMITSLNAILDGKVSEIMQYQEFYRVTDMKRKLVEAETNRIAKLGWTPAYVYALVLSMTRILKDLLPMEQVVEFQGRLAQDPIFQNKTFQLLPQVDLTEKTIDDYISTEEIDGTFEPSTDPSQ